MKVIIWDFGGTLIDTFTVNIQNLKTILIQENIEENDERKIKSLMKESITDTIKYYKDNYGLSDTSIEKFILLNRKLKGEETFLYSGVKETLEWTHNNRNNEFFNNT